VGQYAAEQHRGFAGEDEAYEQRRFAERKASDERVGEWPMQVQNRVDNRADQAHDDDTPLTPTVL
jgi:hypothetical protein